MYDVTFAGNVVRALKRIANLRFTYQLRKTCLANNPRKDQISYLCANNNDMFGNLFKAMAFALLLMPVFSPVYVDAQKADGNVYTRGGITLMNPQERKVALVFTGADMADGADTILSTLKRYRIRGHFFFTGRFFEKFPDVVRRLLRISTTLVATAIPICCISRGTGATRCSSAAKSFAGTWRRHTKQWLPLALIKRRHTISFLLSSISMTLYPLGQRKWGFSSLTIPMALLLMAIIPRPIWLAITAATI